MRRALLLGDARGVGHFARLLLRYHRGLFDGARARLGLHHRDVVVVLLVFRHVLVGRVFDLLLNGIGNPAGAGAAIAGRGATIAGSTTVASSAAIAAGRSARTTVPMTTATAAIATTAARDTTATSIRSCTTGGRCRGSRTFPMALINGDHALLGRGHLLANFARTFTRFGVRHVHRVFLGFFGDDRLADVVGNRLGFRFRHHHGVVAGDRLASSARAASR